MNAPLELEEAQARLLALAPPLGTEVVAAGEALGRYLAEPLIAARTRPSADLSAMDGYALAGEGPWRVIGESRAGHAFFGILREGEAVRISTGAHMPSGASAVLPQEEAARDRDSLTASQPPVEGRHIRRTGSDFHAGDALLGVGDAIGAAAIALALSAGHATLRVGRAPRVAILDSGDELALDPADCPAHRIPASNGAMLAALASALPCRIERIGPVPDDRAALAAALARAEGCDLLVTSGGASVGDHDLIRSALAAWGAELDFWRVAIKPGKPLIVARRGAQLVLGLPGNPVSAFVTAHLFMLPVLRALLGAARPLPPRILLACGVDLPRGGQRREFLRAELVDGLAVQIGERDSGALAALSRARMLIDRPADALVCDAKMPVPVYWLENGGFA